MDATGKGLVSRLSAWTVAPFTTPMDLFDVVLTVILVTTVAVAWLHILKHVQD